MLYNPYMQFKKCDSLHKILKLIALIIQNVFHIWTCLAFRAHIVHTVYRFCFLQIFKKYVLLLTDVKLFFVLKCGNLHFICTTFKVIQIISSIIPYR